MNIDPVNILIGVVVASIIWIVSFVTWPYHAFMDDDLPSVKNREPKAEQKQKSTAYMIGCRRIEKRRHPLKNGLIRKTETHVDLDRCRDEILQRRQISLPNFVKSHLQLVNQ